MSVFAPSRKPLVAGACPDANEREDLGSVRRPAPGFLAMAPVTTPGAGVLPVGCGFAGLGSLASNCVIGFSIPALIFKCLVLKNRKANGDKIAKGSKWIDPRLDEFTFVVLQPSRIEGSHYSTRKCDRPSS